MEADLADKSFCIGKNKGFCTMEMISCVYWQKCVKNPLHNCENLSTMRNMGIIFSEDSERISIE